MPLLGQYLRRDVVRGPADGLPLLALVLEFSGKPEVPHFDSHVFTKEKIPELQAKDVSGCQPGLVGERMFTLCG